MKRLLLVAISVLLVMSLAACGCSAGDTTDTTTTPSIAPTTAPTTEPTTAPMDDVTGPSGGDATTIPGDNGAAQGIIGMR